MSAENTFLPEMLEFFENDANMLIGQANTALAALTAATPDLGHTQPLRNTFHGLRGAAAMVGAAAVKNIVEDIERLLEVADSFKSASPERAGTIFHLVHAQMAPLAECVHHTLAIQLDQAGEVFKAVRGTLRKDWGDYFYESPQEVEAPEAARPEKNTTKHHDTGGDTAAMGADFLASMAGSPAPRPSAPASQSSQALAKAAAPAQRKAVKKAAKSASAPVPAMVEDTVDPEMLTFFVQETAESLERLEATLLTWEKDPKDQNAPKTLFRIAHTIKGAANSIGLSQIGGLMHKLEDLLENRVVDRAFTQQKGLIDLSLSISDAIKALVNEAQGSSPAGGTADRVKQLVGRIVAMDSETPAPLVETPLVVEVIRPGIQAIAETEEVPVPETATSTDRLEMDDRTIRVESDRLDLLMNLTGELVINRTRLEKKLGDIKNLQEEWLSCRSRLLQVISDFQSKHEYSQSRMARDRRTGSGVFLPANRQKDSSGTDAQGFSELEFDQYDDFNILSRSLMEIGTDTSEIFGQLTRFFDSFNEETGQFSKITTALQDEITRTRMVPLSGLFRRLQRVARDASGKERKPVVYESTGGDARMDKVIVDQIYTPLLHVVRNSVAHGIEDAATRISTGKPEEGLVSVDAYYESNQVVIEISDDGRGLNYDAIKAKAIERGILPKDAQPDLETLSNIIFTQGFSTASATTDISGRGVGLDVLRREISRLNGTVHVVSETGQGCTFVVRLPLTLSINQAMLISVGNESYALPLNFIERVVKSTPDRITLSGEQEMFRLDEDLLPVLRLHRLLGLPLDSGKGGAAVIVRVAERRLAVMVDRILHKQDIVVKPLGSMIGRHPMFSGATLSGEGTVVLIIDVPSLVQRVQESNTGVHYAAVDFDASSAVDRSERPTILVVDDSLSIRKVTEKHLKALGFEVELAVDGLDALEKLRLHDISLVLTDLEMPRMHGFELIAEVRRQDALQSLPIIVVTSRDADKHRRRAKELGATDYIIKPFSREQLAEYINRHLALTTAQ